MTVADEYTAGIADYSHYFFQHRQCDIGHAGLLSRNKFRLRVNCYRKAVPFIIAVALADIAGIVRIPGLYEKLVNARDTAEMIRIIAEGQQEQ